MGVAPSSSSSSSKKHEVFLSFRGEDTRRSFTSHLHTALCIKSIDTFIDYELPKGDDISQSLIQAINDSSLSVIVFSQNYANSKWCLNELVQILHCKEHQGQHVVPVFYQVDPSHVRHQRGPSYEKAFEEHLKKKPEKVDQWRKALFETANLAGWHSSNYRDEAELIRNIVDDIIKKLNRGSSTSALADIVGIDENCDHIELLLEKCSTIGIWGMGGIGKTTMARVVFAKFRSQFDCCCFLENFREESKKHGLTHVRDKVLNELSRDTSLERLAHKRVLLVLDDVAETSQLDYLKREARLLGPGSKIIITSRDKHVLKEGRVEKIHEAVALDHKNSLELFKLKAFPKDGFKSEYKELVEKAVAYARGIPLALTVLGSFLFSKTLEEWDSALRKLGSLSNPVIHNVLKLSYDGLDNEEKQIFLDIACFFKGEYKESVKAILESSGFHASIGLRTLEDKALIIIAHTIDHHDAVQMHDLIQSTAFDIVRKGCEKNPGGCSRLWKPNEVYDVLKHNKGTDAIEGISLDLSQIGDLQLRADTFKKMTNLRFLKFYSPVGHRSCIVNLPSGLDSFSESLCYLQWDNFPLKSLPLSSCAEKLVEIHMPHSNLKKLWDGVQDLGNLREIALYGSKHLMELPNLSKARNLERLNLNDCESLSHFHPSIFSLPKLDEVYLYFCRRLESLKSEGQSKSPSRIYVDGCSRLKEISISSEKLFSLDLHSIPVEILEFPSGCMENLKHFSLNCSKLKNLPIDDMSCRMRSLKGLGLCNCGEIIDRSKLHVLFDSFSSLESINLSWAYKLTELPHNIKHLSKLRELILWNCKSLQSLPELPPSTQYIIVGNCKSLQSLPELPPSIESLKAIECTSLKTIQLTSHMESSLLADKRMVSSTLCSSVSDLKNLYELTLSGCEQLYELPESIGSLSSLCRLELDGSNIESLPTSIKHLSNLSYISLRNCTRLHSVPELPFFIEYVDASGCISLETVSTLTTKPCLNSLSLINCLKIENHYLSEAFESVWFPLRQALYTRCPCQFCYPGRKVPEWLKSNQGIHASNKISIELSSTTTYLIGFIICSVLSHHANGHLLCRHSYDGNEYICSSFDGEITKFETPHVFLWCISDPIVKFDKTVTFEFSVVTEGGKCVDGEIEACGVYPIYASEYQKFIEHMGLESNLSAQKETCQDGHDNSFHGILKYVDSSLKIEKCGNLEGSNIPEWFTYKSAMEDHPFYIDLEASVLLDPQVDKLMGFIFCFAIPNFSSKERAQYHCDVFVKSTRVRLNDLKRMNGPRGWHYSMRKLNYSDNVFLWYDPFFSECILKYLQSGIFCDAKYGLRFSFRLYQESGMGECLIKECGVRPIYISEYTNFLHQEKLKVTMGTKRHRDIENDQQELPSTKKSKDTSIDQSIHTTLESKTSRNVDELQLLPCQLNLESTKNRPTHKK